MNNIFTPIPGFSMYEASIKNGIIRNAKTKHVLSPHYVNGYKRLKLINDKGEPKAAFVHQFIALTYLNEYTLEEFYSKDKRYIDHIDGTRHNNDASNLQVVTNSENQKSYQNIKRTNSTRSKRNSNSGTWYTINDDHTINIFQNWYEANEMDPGKDIYFQKKGINVKREIVK